MKQVVCVVLLILACSASSIFDISLDDEWQEFMKVHNKVYESSAVELKRRLIWQSNLKFINRHNKEADEGIHTFRVKMNKFGDLTSQEFNSFYNGFNNSRKTLKVRSHEQFQRPLDVKIPNAIDWRKLGAVSPVQAQSMCGSDYAFSAAASLEGQHFRATGELVVLSAQNLVDCSRAQGNAGCYGGLVDQAFQYIKLNNGVDTNASYPYLGLDQDCLFNPNTVGATLKGFVDIKSGSEDDLTSALGTVGPVSIAIDDTQQSFIFYWSGIYSDQNCSKVDLYHSITAVGYDSMGPGQDYYIVKNSWGANWGMDGYFLIARNQNNMCGVATQASYPLV